MSEPRIAALEAEVAAIKLQLLAATAGIEAMQRAQAALTEATTTAIGLISQRLGVLPAQPQPFLPTRQKLRLVDQTGEHPR